MHQTLASAIETTPRRASTSDDVVDIFQFAIDASREHRVALATLIEIRGGAARPLGSHLAVSSDGRFCGYVSGGCVEAAVATEALLALSEGVDRQVHFGLGSSYFDITLPCGGGITVAIHVLQDVGALKFVIDTLHGRGQAALAYCPASQLLRPSEIAERSGTRGLEFVTVYRPRTRLLVSGAGGETEAVEQLGFNSKFDVIPCRVDGQSGVIGRIADAFTAIALLHHDLDAEIDILEFALGSPAFYIGALGSSRTHRRRTDRLTKLGYGSQTIERIKAPIGMFGPTRDSTCLAISVLADIAAARLAAFP